MNCDAAEMVAILMTDLVGWTAMADRQRPTAAEELRSEHFGLLRGAVERTGALFAPLSVRHALCVVAVGSPGRGATCAALRTQPDTDVSFARWARSEIRTTSHARPNRSRASMSHPPGSSCQRVRPWCAEVGNAW